MGALPGLALQAHQLSDQVSLRPGGTCLQDAELQVTFEQISSLRVKPPLNTVAAGVYMHRDLCDEVKSSVESMILGGLDV